MIFDFNNPASQIPSYPHELSIVSPEFTKVLATGNRKRHRDASRNLVKLFSMGEDKESSKTGSGWLAILTTVEFWRQCVLKRFLFLDVYTNSIAKTSLLSSSPHEQLPSISHPPLATVTPIDSRAALATSATASWLNPGQRTTASIKPPLSASLTKSAAPQHPS